MPISFASTRTGFRSRNRRLKMKEYPVVYEQADANWSAYSPDVPGCIATGKTRQDVETNFRDALEFHLEGLRLHGLSIPEPKAEVGMISVAA